MFELFHYDKNLDEIVIENHYLFTIPEFKKLWTRVNKVKNDADGRNKLQNKKEFMYIFFMENLSKKNPFRILAEDLRHIEAVKAVELDPNFKPDDLLLTCCQIYAKHVIEYTPTLKFLVQLEQTILQVQRQVSILRIQNESLLLSLEESKENATAKDLILMTDSISVIQENISRIFNLLNAVNQMQTKKKDLEKKIKEEEEALENITGKRKLGNRENPVRL